MRTETSPLFQRLRMGVHLHSLLCGGTHSGLISDTDITHLRDVKGA